MSENETRDFLTVFRVSLCLYIFLISAFSIVISIQFKDEFVSVI